MRIDWICVKLSDYKFYILEIKLLQRIYIKTNIIIITTKIIIYYYQQ